MNNSFFLQIYGESNSKSGIIDLSDTAVEKHIVDDTTNQYQIDLPRLGNLEKIEIEYDCAVGSVARSFILISDLSSGSQWKFYLNKWFGKKEGIKEEKIVLEERKKRRRAQKEIKFDF
eukprot:TRINITY_DN2400_c0_g3_i3.p1 TRINITY_DN2400_c0_g3~~TRINITY_DN2400_c0_g3_i3.p1  ORF type:complete len:118 (+),score=41.07 TRINITY_DN2400_c0_g3_i3:159-512(+)